MCILSTVGNGTLVSWGQMYHHLIDFNLHIHTQPGWDSHNTPKSRRLHAHKKQTKTREGLLPLQTDAHSSYSHRRINQQHRISSIRPAVAFIV